MLIDIRNKKQYNCKTNMKKLTKIELIADIKNLNAICEFITRKNFYEMIVKFYSITSKLYDNIEEIEKFPPRGWTFLRIKTKKRKIAEKAKSDLIYFIKKYGRYTWCNRSTSSDKITKDNIYLQGGYDFFPISVLEIEDNPCSEYVNIDNEIDQRKTDTMKADISWLN